MERRWNMCRNRFKWQAQMPFGMFQGSASSTEGVTFKAECCTLARLVKSLVIVAQQFAEKNLSSSLPRKSVPTYGSKRK